MVFSKIPRPRLKKPCPQLTSDREIYIIVRSDKGVVGAKSVVLSTYWWKNAPGITLNDETYSWDTMNRSFFEPIGAKRDRVFLIWDVVFLKIPRPQLRRYTWESLNYC